MPKGRDHAAWYVNAFIENVRASGLVAKTIQDKVVGLTISGRQ